MLRAIEGAAVLALLSVFFAYILAPALPPVRRRVRIGRRRRPISDAGAILVVYAAIAAPAILAGRAAVPSVRHWIAVTAPASIERLFPHGPNEPLDAALARLPLSPVARRPLRQGFAWLAGVLERSTRSTLAELVEAAPYARWLAVTPMLALMLLTAAPVFQRSALRVLPHGHLQWRFVESLRDVNSALAGYVRAQAAAAVIVGAACVAGFVLLGTPSAISLGVLAGILELVSSSPLPSPASSRSAGATGASIARSNGCWRRLPASWSDSDDSARASETPQNRDPVEPNRAEPCRTPRNLAEPCV
ncbi:MAG: AI-2E family transporter [Acidobacteriota bacterium]